MVKYLALLTILTASSCIHQKSEGIKYGLLQKVSHRQDPCDYYVAEVAYEGSRLVKKGIDDDYEAQNSQEFEINKAAFDSLQIHVGNKIVFHYLHETTNNTCGLDIDIDQIAIKP